MFLLMLVWKWFCCGVGVLWLILTSSVSSLITLHLFLYLQSACRFYIVLCQNMSEDCSEIEPRLCEHDKHKEVLIWIVNFKIFFKVYASGGFSCIYQMHVWWSQRPQRVLVFPRTGVTGIGFLCVCWVFKQTLPSSFSPKLLICVLRLWTCTLKFLFCCNLWNCGVFLHHILDLTTLIW